MATVAPEENILTFRGDVVQLAAAELCGQLELFADRTQLGLNCASVTL